MKLTSEIEVKIPSGRIVDVKLLKTGGCQLIIEHFDESTKVISNCDTSVLSVSREENNWFEKFFVLIEASKLSLSDKFMQYNPENEQEKAFKNLLEKVIAKGVKDFYHPFLSPSYSANENKIIFQIGDKPLIGKSFIWWENAVKQLLPERNSRLGTKSQYIAFIGCLMKIMVEHGMSVDTVWHSVCVDSKDIGNYSNSNNANPVFEMTGSNEVYGFCDLANEYKILAEDEDEGTDGFWLASGSMHDYSFEFPIADMYHKIHLEYGIFGTGWIVSD